MDNKNTNASEMILRALNDVEDEMIEEAAPRNIHLGPNVNSKPRESQAVSLDAAKKNRKKNSPLSYIQKNWKKIGSIAACLILIVVGGTAALSNMGNSRNSYSLENSSSAEYKPSGMISGYYSNGAYVYESEYAEAEGEIPKEWGDMETTTDSINSISNYNSNTQSNSNEQKLIYTANLRLETLEFDQAVREIKDRIVEMGGFIESDDIYDSSNGYWYNDNYEKTKGTMTENLKIRIPAEKYQEFLQEASSVNGKVTSLSQNVENITRRYNDLSTTIQSLRTQETRLLEMLESAETVEDMIYIESRLSEVQNELALYQNNLNEMDTDVAYSTVNVKITEVVKYTNTTAPKSTFAERLENTVVNSGESFLQFLENALFFVITILPEVILGVVLLIIVLVIYRSRKKKKTLPAEKKKESSEE